jgi:hypothetical protein
VRLVLSLIGLAPALVLLQASQEAKPAALAPWTQLTIVDVVPSMVEEYVAVERELTTRARDEKIPWRAVSRTEVFGNRYRFVIATPLSSLGSFDRKSEPDSRLSSLEERASRCVTRRETFAVRNLSDLSNPLPQGETPGLMLVNVARVVPGREQDYVNVMKSDFLPHFQEAKVHHLSGILALGGETGFLHVFYYESFADLDRGSPVMQALGPEGALAASAKLAGIVSSSSLSVTRLIPELSFFPEAKKEKP